MPKRTDIHKIMVIGSGPIVIGQAAEFDYAGTQACLALKEEGYEVVLCNSNPATIMTDITIADKVYIEPLTLESVSYTHLDRLNCIENTGTEEISHFFAVCRNSLRRSSFYSGSGVGKNAGTACALR